MKELRKLDFNEVTDFECGGRHFYISEHLGFIRYKKSQEFMLEFGYSMSFIDIFNNLGKAEEAFNQHKYFDMATIIYKIREGIKAINDKDDPALRLCALFINERDEDITKYDEAQMKAKINCWASELEVSPFFHLAANFVSDWTNVYQKYILSGLANKEEKNKEK